MAAITIERTNNTIVITKAFDKKASVYGSAEYNMLQNAMKDNPGFSVKVNGSKKSNKNPFSKISFEFMEKYIKGHDDLEHTVMNEYLKMRGEDDESIAKGGVSQNRDTICEWFVDKYPEIREFHLKRKQIADEMAEIKRERKEQQTTKARKARLDALFAA